MFHEIQEPVFGSSFRLRALCMELFWHLFDQNNYQNTPVKPGTESERILFEQLSQFMKKTWITAETVFLMRYDILRYAVCLY